MQTVSHTPRSAALATAAAAISRASFSSSLRIVFMSSRPACTGTAGRIARHPGNRDVAIHKGLAGHTVSRGKIGFGQMPALLWLNRIGVVPAMLYPAAAGPPQPPAAFERNPASLAQRYPQQITVPRCGDRLHRVGDEG